MREIAGADLLPNLPHHEFFSKYRSDENACQGNRQEIGEM